MKKQSLDFMADIKPVDIYETILDIENDFDERNDYNWQISFGSEKDIVSMLEDVISEMDFYNVDYITRYGSWYWCGVLCEEPWCELGYYDEEYILNLIVKYHIIVNNNHGIFITFKNNTQSPLYRFFLKYRDGYGGNIPHDINSVLYNIKKFVKAYLEKNGDRYATYEEVAPYLEEELEEV